METFSFLFLGAAAYLLAVTNGSPHTTNSWAVEIKYGGDRAARELADKYGFFSLGKIGDMENMYTFILKDSITDKAATMLFFGHESLDYNDVMDYPEAAEITDRLHNDPLVIFAEQQERHMPAFMHGYDVPQNSSLFHSQWQLRNSGNFGQKYIGHDLQVEKAWLLGVTGCGVTVAVVDDGIYYQNVDLIDNYVKAIQYDSFSNSNADIVGGGNHGTQCAGAIAMKKGNGKCGVGVAYNARITSFRVVRNGIGTTDAQYVSALYRRSNIDIYSCSFGDHGTNLRIYPLANSIVKTLQRGVKRGRNGKGSIYVFAAGNEFPKVSCSANKWVNRIETIAVGALNYDGTPAYYDQGCPGKMVTAFVDGWNATAKVISTTNSNQDGCTTTFTGTSAATPLVSGTVALLLEANPALTWRDVQHLLIYTANRDKINVRRSGERWSRNGAGLFFNPHFGFGVVDAEALVSRGKIWTNVPAVIKDVYNFATMNFEHNDSVTTGGPIRSTKIQYLEHVVLILSCSFSNYATLPNGKIEVTLTSPSGTKANLMTLRPDDMSDYQEYNSYPLLALQFWGENPRRGAWEVMVRSIAGIKLSASISMELYGTSTRPASVSRPVCSRECPKNCAIDHTQKYVVCDACAKLRDSDTGDCICSNDCPAALTKRNQYCYNAAVAESTCDSLPGTKPPPTDAPVTKPLHIPHEVIG